MLRTLEDTFLTGRRMPRALAVVLGAALFGSLANAQTNWSIEGSGPSYGEYNAPPPLCGVLPGPPPYTVNAPPVGTCPSNGPFPPSSCVGGTAVDQNGNILSGGGSFPVILNSDGIMLEMTSPAGAYIASAPIGGGAVLPGLISGLAVDSLTDVTYISDGASVAGVGLPPATCGPPAVVVGPFPAPTPVLTCGLAFDPCTGTLWAVDAAGGVINFTTGGAFIGGFVVGAPLTPPMSGITVNATNGNIQVTDGTVVVEYTPAGVIAPAGPFYLSANPFTVPAWGAPVDGLGFALAPLRYGRGCSTVKPLPPTIGSTGGYTYAGNGAFTIVESGAMPGMSTFLIISFSYSCPSIPFGCGGFWVGLPWFALLPLGPVPASGTVTVPAPLPPAIGCGLPVGVPIFAQFMNFGGGGMEQTEALAFTIGAL